MSKKTDQSKVFKGIVASPGIAIGKIFVLNRFHLCIIKQEISAQKVKEEIQRFDSAIDATKKRMLETVKNNVKSMTNNLSYILHPQIQLLEDPSIIDATREMIEKEKVNGEWALKYTYDKLTVRFKAIKDPFYRDRLRDFEGVINSVLQTMTGLENDDIDSIQEPVVVVAHELSPFDAIRLTSSNILGFVTEVGGKTSHTGIIASSLHIPALVGVQKITRFVQAGDTVIIDAFSGRLHLHPTEKSFQFYNKRRQDYLYFDQKLESEEAGLAAETKDGVRVFLKGNVESSQDVKSSIEHGAEGIGLFRSEYLFLNRGNFPTDEEQFQEYKKVAEEISPHHAVIRTLDIGGDKVPVSWDEEIEANPALGLRAIRYCLTYKQVFTTQLRAILRASHYGKLRIMYPMISGVEEVMQANQILEKEKKALRKQKIPFDESIKVGIMVEVPSVALTLGHFAQYVDFVSIGTNDLIQYLLAVDRGNEKVAMIYEPLHPAVIRTLQIIIRSANESNIPVSVCGQMSADPVYSYLLTGMGKVDDLSMESHSIPKVKKFLRSISSEDARNDVAKIMQMSRIKDIRKYLVNKLSPLLEDGLISEVGAEDFGKGVFD
ncbi:MAG: phosphoenolpyruvate--protein phosphotransferase [Nitrospinota bacterium]|nr:phosphoenolpyruvate--protein phosphotransferase [Nitrospinota bacterium]